MFYGDFFDIMESEGDFMIRKSAAIDRFLKENPQLRERRFGLPDIGRRLDHEKFNPTVQAIADAIDFYGYEVRDENITVIPDIDLGGGNPIRSKPFPLAIAEMRKALDEEMYRYPYTEGDDRIRKVLLDYIEQEGFINTEPYSYSDVDEKGLSVHNLTFLPSTSITFNLIINIISRPGDVVLMPGPNYGLFIIRAERAGAEVEILPVTKEDHFLVDPDKLAAKIDEINASLKNVYHRRKGYVPRVVAFVNANPNNPTGKVMGESETDRLTKIGRVCLERGVFVIDDLVYRDLVFEQKNIAKPMASIPGMFRNTISLFGLSKSYGMAGLRAGFVVADEIVIREVINRIFQEMDSAPDIVGRALAGAFNTSLDRKQVYETYFADLRKRYLEKYYLLYALVEGIDTVPENYREMVRSKVTARLGTENANDALTGLLYTHFPSNLEPDAGFFAILDFTELKGMKYKGHRILTERDLLQFFYKTCRIRFLVGQSISWPYPDELVGRVTFALDDEVLIDSFYKMHNALKDLMRQDDYIIRKNELKDQEQMAHIKVDGWRNAYDRIIASRYLNQLDYEKQTSRYIASFDEYQDLVFVAARQDEILGYACFDPKAEESKYDSELVSLYLKPSQVGQGIGTALFEAVVKELSSKGCHNMIVWCLSDNQKGIDFYRKLGGNIVEVKQAKIGGELYLEYGFYYDLDSYLAMEGAVREREED